MKWNGIYPANRRVSRIVAMGLLALIVLDGLESWLGFGLDLSSWGLLGLSVQMMVTVFGAAWIFGGLWNHRV